MINDRGETKREKKNLVLKDLDISETSASIQWQFFLYKKIIAHEIEILFLVL